MEKRIFKVFARRRPFLAAIDNIENIAVNLYCYITLFFDIKIETSSGRTFQTMITHGVRSLQV